MRISLKTSRGTTRNRCGNPGMIRVRFVAMIRSFAILLCSASLLPAELPEFYKKVDHVVWVVPNLSSTLAGWMKAGVNNIEDRGMTSVSGAQYRGQASQMEFLVSQARFGDVWVDWLQATGAKGPLSEFAARTGGGVFGLMHRVPSRAALDAEVDRMRGLGVAVLMRGGIDDRGMHFLFFDTSKHGKYALGLIFDPEDDGGLPAGNASLAITQYAFAVRDLGPVSEYWEKLGFPKMSVSKPQLSKTILRGRPVQYTAELGWQRHGKVPYEWCKPVEGPTAYEEHMKLHGEGFHHIGVRVDEMDQAIAAWSERGFPVLNSGAWGEEGKPGSGRFAYIDTDRIGGVIVELLWNYRAPAPPADR